MNTRFCTVVTVVVLLCLSTGCSGMKNFIFGRGARCGLCTKIGSCLPAPSFGNVMQAPAAAPACQAPAYAPAPSYAPAPAYSAAPSCGCNDYAGISTGQESYASGMCGTCGDSYMGGGSYAPQIVDGANYGMNPYGVGNVDPYLNGTSGNTLVPGQQINGETVVGVGPVQSAPNYPSGTSYPAAPSYNGTPTYNGNTGQSDNFQSRKFDTDGNKILWEEPLAPGTKAL